MLKLLEEEIKGGFGKWRDEPPPGPRRATGKTPLPPDWSTELTRLQAKPKHGFVRIQTNQL